MKILIVDDSSTFRKIARNELEKGGYEILEAKNGNEALEIIHSVQIDLVTLDVEMPHLDGYQTCTLLRSEEYETLIPRKVDSILPVIFVTACDTLAERSKGFDAGAADFITKPFLPGELLLSVNKILQPEMRFDGLSALVVDDSVPTRIILTQIFQKLGMKVYQAENGVQGYELMRSKLKEIDIVITDFYMPEMNGEELCQKIRNDLNHKGIPIIFLSGLSEKSSILDMFKVGANDYLVKPFVKEELLSRIEVHLTNRILSKELNAKVINLKRLNHMKDKFMSVCSHDMRSPLSSVLGFSNLLCSESLDDTEKKEVAGKIRSSTEFLVELIDDLLELGRIQSETDEWEKETLRIKEILDTSLSTLHNLYTEKNLRIELGMEAVEGFVVRGNSNALVRVFNNLLSNAIKFTPSGGDIKILAEENNESEIAVSVIDSGIGIPKEKRNHLFDVFTKTSQSGTEGEKGTGLGLSITKQLVERHEGTIEVESKAGCGSTFKVILPCVKENLLVTSCD